MRLTARVRPLAWLCVTACSTPDHPPPPFAVEARAPLGAGVAAHVGAVPIAASVVGAVAQARGVSPRAALELEIADALLEHAAHSRGIDEQFGVRAAVRGVLARARLELLRGQASIPEVRAQEVEEATARHFVELDRPETFRVAHALVKLPDRADDASRGRARVVAEGLAARLLGAVDEGDFRARAESLPDRGGFEVVVESLSPVAADGRVISIDPPLAGGRYEEPFARAAARLQRTGEQSPIVSTSFGFHVLMLLAKLPGRAVPYAERRALLQDEILTDRARAARNHLIEELRARTPPTLERSADALMASVDVAPHEGP